MDPVITIWLLTIGLFLTHQLEEIVYPIASWQSRHRHTPWKRWNKYIDNTPMASPRLIIRLRTLGIQLVGISLIMLLTVSSLLLTQVVATVLLSVFIAAFLMHIIASLATRSAMPGLSSSILPGIPAAILILIYIWR